MAEILGRVTAEIPEDRGPDAVYDLRVPRAWLAAGATIVIDVPHQLPCALCSGGGCDACGRTGAVTLRARDEPAQPLVLTLPCRPESQQNVGVILRIQGRGGPPAPGRLGPPGLLLVRVRPTDGEPPERVALAGAGRALIGDGLAAAPSARASPIPGGFLLLVVLAAMLLWAVWGL